MKTHMKLKSTYLQWHSFYSVDLRLYKFNISIHHFRENLKYISICPEHVSVFNTSCWIIRNVLTHL